MSESGSEFVGYDVRDNIAWARLNHGKANALSAEVLTALDRCLTLAEANTAVGALCITGKPGFLTGGFDEVGDHNIIQRNHESQHHAC